MVRVINIDWLEVYCMADESNGLKDASFFEREGWRVLRRDYGTRVYNEMFTLCETSGKSFLEIRRDPCSKNDGSGGILPSNGCHIRLTNYACYGENPIQRLREFLAKYHFTLISIYRLDICMDFEHFDTGDDPQRFIRRYIDGRYSKMNQANVSVYGKDTWEQRVWNSLSWGAKKSMIGTKLYCKTLELAESKDKPYIRWAWFKGDLVDDPIRMIKRAKDGTTYKPVIWRLEFSIRATAKHWFVIDRCDTKRASKLYRPHTLSMYDTREKLMVCFQALCSHYFRFKYYEDGVRKDRCRDKDLFRFTYQDEQIKIGGQVSEKVPVTFKDRLLRLLDTFASTTFDAELKKAAGTLIKALRDTATRNYMGDTFTEEEILLMQRLVAGRFGDMGTAELEEERQVIKSLIQDTQGQIF